MDNGTLSKLKEAFPKHISISGRDEFFNSSVLIPLVMIDEEYYLIFQKRSKNISQAGEVCFPGGKFDLKLDKNSMETSLREINEEFSMAKEKVNIIGRMNTVFSPIGAMVDGYVGILDIGNIEEININLSEVEYIFTVPVSYFEKNKPEKYCVQIKAHPSVIDSNGNESILLPYNELHLPETYSKPWGAYKYNIYVYKYGKEIIWGLTARFILDLVDMLNN